MECKYEWTLFRAYKSKGINRYIMECKLLLYDLLHSIDTSELIDTLWNVNCEDAMSGIYPDYRINRYIMECKCITWTYLKGAKKN